MKWGLDDVYIIFGDMPRSDGGNIYGVFKNESSAKEEMELLKQRRPFEAFHIEVFGFYE